MGRYDSSRFRVAPVFDALLARDATGASWLPALLNLGDRARQGGGHVVNGIARSSGIGSLTRASWTSTTHGRREASLPAPRSLLHWLVGHARAPKSASAWGPDRIVPLRRALVDGDAATRRQAHAAIDAARSPAMDWFVLEGPSRPDAYIETTDLVLVVEGKLTERGPTTSTSWMPVRHQIIRHMDAAWERAAGRAVYGLVIVEGLGAGKADALPAAWSSYSGSVVEPTVLAACLPHRIDAVREELREGFLGVTTWCAVCATTDLSRDSLPRVPNN